MALKGVMLYITLKSVFIVSILFNVTKLIQETLFCVSVVKGMKVSDVSFPDVGGINQSFERSTGMRHSVIKIVQKNLCYAKMLNKGPSQMLSTSKNTNTIHLRFDTLML